MGCCLVLAFVMAFLVRPFRRGQRVEGFAPPAARGTSVEPLALIDTSAVAQRSASASRGAPARARRGGRASDAQPRARRLSLRFGLAAGVLAHALAVSLLLAGSVAEAEGLSPWVRALGLGALAVALVAGIQAPRGWLDLPSVLVVAGGTAFVLGLVDMHAVGAFSLGSAPSLTVDLLVHGAPLVVVALGAALELRRPTSPLVSGVR